MEKNNNSISGMKAGDIVMEALHAADMTPAREYYKECFEYVRKHAEQSVVGEGHASRRWYNPESVRKTAMEFISKKKKGEM